MDLTNLKDVVRDAPKQSGVYSFRDVKGRVVYIGKAISLNNRLRSYLRIKELNPKTKVMIENAESLDYTITDSESEALLLEYNLIKEHAPKYNVRYRDGKRYPYIEITNERFPRVHVTRRKEADGGRYFGPYPDGSHIRKILRIVKQYFGLRTCKGDARKNKPCLNIHIGRCAGPCTGKLPEKQYNELVEQASLFLGGRIKELSKVLSERMRVHADRQEYEGAAVMRDKIFFLDSILLERKVSAGDGRDRDFIAYAREGDFAGVSVFVERGGLVVGHFFFRLDGEFRFDEVESLASFISQYYATSPIPDEVVVSFDVGLSRFLGKRKGRRVSVKVPKRGRLKRLLSLVGRNASLQVTQEAFGLGKARALEALSRILGVAVVDRIEGFDVSNLSGKHAVGSMVLFEDGKPVKSGYRRFRIKTVSGTDDVAMMSEVVSRRFGNKWPRPHVILVDGGRGQVNAARRVLREAGEVIPVIGLAKEHEEVYVGGRAGRLSLPLDSPVMRLLIRVRDEAHRFAVTYHRRVRSNVIVSGFKS